MARTKGSINSTTPKKRSKALNQVLAGKSQKDIAKDMGMTQQGVSALLSDSECKAAIDRYQRELIAVSPDIRDRFIRHCQSPDAKISLDAIKHYHQITSIAPSHAQSPFIQQIFIHSDTGLQDAEFRQLAMRFIGLEPGPDPAQPLIDVTPEQSQSQTSKP